MIDAVTKNALNTTGDQPLLEDYWNHLETEINPNVIIEQTISHSYHLVCFCGDEA